MEYTTFSVPWTKLVLCFLVQLSDRLEEAFTFLHKLESLFGAENTTSTLTFFATFFSPWGKMLRI